MYKIHWLGRLNLILNFHPRKCQKHYYKIKTDLLTLKVNSEDQLRGATFGLVWRPPALMGAYGSHAHSPKIKNFQVSTLIDVESS